GINIAAAAAAKDAVLTGSRIETPAAQLRVNADGEQPGKRYDNVTEDQIGGGHAFLSDFVIRIWSFCHCIPFKYQSSPGQTVIPAHPGWFEPSGSRMSA